jgi:hypothetical protein
MSNMEQGILNSEAPASQPFSKVDTANPGPDAKGPSTQPTIANPLSLRYSTFPVQNSILLFDHSHAQTAGLHPIPRHLRWIRRAAP